MDKKELKTDKLFEKLTVPCSQDELEHLEQSLLRKGCMNPITTWNGVILDGHKRYRICMVEEIDFSIRELHFQSSEDAIIWVCRQRAEYLPKYRLIFKYLVGKWYETAIVINRRKEKNIQEDSQFGDSAGDIKKHRYRTSIEIGDELELNHATVEKYKSFAITLDTILEKEPPLFDLLMLGEYKVTNEKLLQMASWSQRKLYEERRRTERSRTKKVLPNKSVSLKRSMLKERYEIGREIPLTVGIKEMPAFDPDMELRGLILTIPTWMNAIARAQSKTDMSLVSNGMKQQLADTLSQFRQQIDQMMEVL